jgi:hypothetical protein
MFAATISRRDRLTDPIYQIGVQFLNDCLSHVGKPQHSLHDTYNAETVPLVEYWAFAVVPKLF